MNESLGTKPNELRGLHVQYGCGTTAPETWENFDSSPTLCFERLPFIGRLYTKNDHRFPQNVRYGDIVRGLPLAESSCAGIYASHVLEHLHLEDCRKALRNTFHLLMPQGIFRVIVPDLETAAKKYLANPSSNAAERFLMETSLGRAARAKGFIGFCTAFLGHSQHLWMWDYKGFIHELEAAGFSEVRSCAPGDSEDPFFKEVENPERFIDAVSIQCRRPAR